MGEEGHLELPINSEDSSIKEDEELRMFRGALTLGNLIDALEAYDGSPVISLHSGLNRQLFIYTRPVLTVARQNKQWVLEPPFDHPLRNVQIDEAVASCEASERTRVDNKRLVLIRRGQAAQADRLRPKVAAHVGLSIYFTAYFASCRDLFVQWRPDSTENQNGRHDA